MNFRTLVSLILLSTLVILLLSTAVQATEYRKVNTEVQAEDILKHIENGDDVYLDNCSIVGELDVNKIKLETVPNPNYGLAIVYTNEEEFEYYESNENLKVIESNIAVENSTFKDNICFSNVSFNDSAYFSGTNFSGSVDFNNSNFSSSAAFDNSNFYDDANFNNVNFSQAWFNEANFNSSANFYCVRFNSYTDFNNANFNSDADFSETQFSTYYIDGINAGQTFFSNANFNGSVSFSSVHFYSQAWFNEANFNSSAVFNGISFSDYAFFFKTNFNSDVDFSNDIFYGVADFNNMNFNGDASFLATKFSSNVDFLGTNFNSSADFRSTDFNSLANLKAPETPDNIISDGESCEAFRKAYESETRYGDADTIYYNYRKFCQDDKDLTSLSKWSDIICWITCGYGLKPLRIFWPGAFITGFFTLLYCLGSGIYRSSDADTKMSEVSFWDALYFSINTFTTLGSTDWYPKDNFRKWVTLEGLCGWIFLGIFMATLANILIR